MYVMITNKEDAVGNRTFQKRAFGNSSTYTCSSCKHLTRTTDNDAANCNLCALCYEEAGLENAHSDGHHKTEVEPLCYQCNPKVLTVKQVRANQLALKAAKATDTTPVRVEDKKEATMATNVKLEVAKLIKKLVSLKDKSDAEGRKIRRVLRSLGHKGGVGHAPKAAPKKAKAKKADKPNIQDAAYTGLPGQKA